MMEETNRALVLDGNAVAGLMRDIFAEEMTTAPMECGGCGKVFGVGEMLVFGQAMGTIMRCPGCNNVMVRIVKTPRSFYVDARGSACMVFSRRAE